MAITIVATYENGVLKLEHPLPLKEHERVRVTVETEEDPVSRSYGMLRWTGDHETLRYLAEDVDLDPQEGP
jgi:predicted DNA-binding antitoxin AbrB/MazE fold protein